jgi:hypothetical protein
MGDRRYLFIITNEEHDYDEHYRAYVIAKTCKEAMELFRSTSTYANCSNDKLDLAGKYKLAVNLMQYINIDDVLNDTVTLEGLISIKAIRLDKSSVAEEEYYPG